jgi:hypothetical protein
MFFPIGLLEEGLHFEQLDTWKYRNHSGANDYLDEINKYLGKESDTFCILGPFKSNPFTSGLKISIKFCSSKRY